MPIAGVVLVVDPKQAMEALKQLDAMDKVTTYGIHKEINIVAVFEGESSRELEKLSETILKSVPGVQGIYPAYVNYELDEEEALQKDGDWMNKKPGN